MRGTLAGVLRRARRRVVWCALRLLGERRRRILAWWAMQFTAVHTVTAQREGIRWVIPVGDPYIGFGLFVDGGFAQAEISALLAWLAGRGRGVHGGSVFVDVGANIGSTCIPVVRTCGCRGLAIEPVPDCLALLDRNVSQNGLAPSIRIVAAAVQCQSGRVTLTPGDNIGASEVVPAGAEQPDRGQAIIARGQPLSDILDAEGIIAEEVALVWSDVQGCERDVILTGAGLWRRGVPLWVECAPVLLARHGGCAAFLEAARTHFIACIDAATLLREGAAALPRPISELAAIIDAVDMSTDVLLLPSGFDRPHPGSGT